MCGRVVDLALRSEGLDTSWLKITPIPRRFNVKPTEPLLILGKQSLGAMLARWWLIPPWFDGQEAKDRKATTFNARIEEARENPAFRRVWRHGRCQMPVGGSYELTGAMAPGSSISSSRAGNEETLFLAGGCPTSRPPTPSATGSRSKISDARISHLPCGRHNRY
ncbi:SOS response-associated peptidase family protein [Gemmobacter sp. 24YEA27]|uniref:SOS response-associated peptidase family protein n=1 Tax=Gemmobacter sp. 24YEA27 TaxID=3040672 RepID=UPI0024B33B18|nr:SOS response-associated peptidase family protein [Gemmobacter sp. 24YEA27]